MTSALVALMIVSCVTEEAQERSTKELATQIWHEVDNDLKVVHSILRNVVHVDYMLGLAEAEREAYIEQHLPHLNNSNTNGRYLLTVNTTYDTSYTTIFDTGGKPLCDGGEWHVSSPSGTIFEIDIKAKPDDENSIVVTFQELIISESSGNAQLEISYNMAPNDEGINEAIIEYKGEMTMVDPEASSTRVLTLKTKIGYMEYHEFKGKVAGTLEILCIDELYDTEDRVFADITHDPRRIFLECYGEQFILYE